MTKPAGRVAVVTGASSGIGEATARRLASDGWQVIAAARRRDRLDALAAAVPRVTAMTVDVTDDDSVRELAAAVPRCDLLVANAGAAYGLAPVAESDPSDWARMYDLNVVGVVRCVSALLPAIVASGDGHVILTGSTAGRWVYENGGGYVASKHAVAALRDTLRLELAGQSVRVSEIAPGMVRTEEFSLVRFDGDAERAAAVYAGVEALTAADVADAVAWVASRPSNVNIDLLQLTPRQQASATKVLRHDR